jgi:hypothetical protein
MSEKADFEPSLKRASHFVKIIVFCPHRLPKLPESTLGKQARPNNGSLFYSHCDQHPVAMYLWSVYVSLKLSLAPLTQSVSNQSCLRSCVLK